MYFYICISEYVPQLHLGGIAYPAVLLNTILFSDLEIEFRNVELYYSLCVLVNLWYNNQKTILLTHLYMLHKYYIAPTYALSNL